MDTKQIVDALEQIAETLKPYAEKTWEILIRQQIIDGYINLGASLIALVMIVLCGLFVKKNWNNNNMTDSALGVCCLIIGVVSVVIFIACGIDAIRLLNNPEYFAIKDLIRK